MLKDWRFWLCIGAVAVLLSGTGYAALTSPELSNCEHHQGQYPTAGNKENKASAIFVPAPNEVRIIWSCIGGYTNANGSAITAIATVLLTIVTGLLGYLAWDQGRTTRAQLRAYMFVDKADIAGLEVGATPFATIKMKNFGQTPAKNFRHWARLTYAPFPLQNPIRPLDKAVLAPRAFPPLGDTRAHPRLPVPLSQMQIDALGQGIAAIYILGAMDYTDVFGIDRWTTYFLLTGGPAHLTGLVVQHTEGNDYY